MSFKDALTLGVKDMFTFFDTTFKFILIIFIVKVYIYNKFFFFPGNFLNNKS